MAIKTTKTLLALTDQAREIIKRRAPSDRKHGAWVCRAIIEYDRMLTATEQPDPTRLAKDVTEMKAMLRDLLMKGSPTIEQQDHHQEAQDHHKEPDQPTPLISQADLDNLQKLINAHTAGGK